MKKWLRNKSELRLNVVDNKRSMKVQKRVTELKEKWVLCRRKGKKLGLLKGEKSGVDRVIMLLLKRG